MKYFIKTYGCQMNYSDSERIAGILEMAGYQKTLSEDNADLIVINACSVRQSAINRISGRFKKYKKLRKINPALKIVLTGCVLESDKKKFEEMFDLVIGIGEIKKMCWFHSPEGLWNLDAKSQLGSTELTPLWNQHNIPLLSKGARGISSDYFQIKPLRQNKFSAYAPIMTGCNNFCSYCVVPHTRGREYSRPVEDILNEVENLVKQGYKEIILLGQNVNSYQSEVHKFKKQKCILSFPPRIGVRGKLRQESIATPSVPKHTNFYNKTDPPNWIPASAGMTGSVGMAREINFPILLKLINAIPGNFWIRFLTSHPKDMSEELIKTVAECEKVTPHIHLALQSGNNKILKKMNRKYTAGHFLGLVKMIRKYLPDAAISTDIIIGFPGETEKQFQNTVEVMKKAKFDMAYLNKYSPRPETAAARLVDDISWEEKKRREKILNEILKKTALENNEKYIGKVVEILVNKVDDRFIYGKTESFKNVRIGIMNQESGIKIGKFVNIKITQADAWGLEGEMVR